MSLIPDIDPDITRALGLPASTYTDPAVFAHQRSTVFARTWHAFAESELPGEPGEMVPWTLLPGCLDEPLLLIRSEAEGVRCFSNACTHRGALLVDRPTRGRSIRCPYHGRRFDLAGRVLAAPGFDGCPGFPAPSDHLPAPAFETWQRLGFASLRPSVALEDWLGPVQERAGVVLDPQMRWMPEHARLYHVEANWALYCDNYLEGFHIPFVHPGLRRTLDVAAYRIELLPLGVLQIGIAAEGEPTFDLPKSHPDHGLGVAAYYFWLFPATMLNLYPWGISLNAVLPMGPRITKIAFARWVWNDELHGRGAGSDLDQVEMEDEAVVERTSRGLQGALKERGRYAPDHEQGLHHFHRLLTRFMRDDR